MSGSLGFSMNVFHVQAMMASSPRFFCVGSARNTMGSFGTWNRAAPIGKKILQIIYEKKREREEKRSLTK